MRRLVTAVLIPLLVIGVFGGTTFLAHRHDDRGVHLHTAPTEATRSRLAAHCDHGSLPGHHHDAPGDQQPSETDGDQDPSTPLADSNGLVISIPDHEQMVARGMDLGLTLSHLRALPYVLVMCWTPPGLGEEPGAPGGFHQSDSPLHLSGASAGQRLIRTSQALLI